MDINILPSSNEVVSEFISEEDILSSDFKLEVDKIPLLELPMN